MSLASARAFQPDDHPNCGRCFAPTRATETLRIMIRGKVWELSLCDQHTRMFDADINGWLRAGRHMTADPEPSKPATPTPREERAPLAPVAKRTDPTPAAASAKPPAARTAAPTGSVRSMPRTSSTHPRGYVPFGVTSRHATPAERVAGEWTLTTHARERMAERGLTEHAVWAVIASPTASTRPGKRGDGVVVYELAGVKVYTNPATKEVITVAKRDEVSGIGAPLFVAPQSV